MYLTITLCLSWVILFSAATVATVLNLPIMLDLWVYFVTLIFWFFPALVVAVLTDKILQSLFRG